MTDTPTPPRYSVRSLLVMMTLLSPILTIVAKLGIPLTAAAALGLVLFVMWDFFFDLDRSNEPREPSYRKRMYHPPEPLCDTHETSEESRPNNASSRQAGVS
jgi:hypothetical protein